MIKASVLTVIGFAAVTSALPILPRWMDASEYGVANVFVYNHTDYEAIPEYVGYEYMSWDF